MNQIRLWLYHIAFGRIVTTLFMQAEYERIARDEHKLRRLRRMDFESR